MTRLLLIRHGETDWNSEGRYQGQSDVPLNATGREQARHLAQALDGCALDTIYSSDLLRARETAEALARATGASLYLDPRLREVDLGEWEGQLFSCIQEKYPELLRQRRENPLHFAPPGGETMVELRQRLLSAVREIAALHPGASVALVSHGFALAVIKVSLNGQPVERVWDLVPGNAEMEWVEVGSA